MKITLKQLRQIIKEEIDLSESVAESNVDRDIEIGYDSEEEAQQAMDSIDWLPGLVGDVTVDMEKSEIPAVKKSIIRALNLLKDKASEEYNLVQRNLKNISSGEKSGIDIKNKKFSIADPSILDQSAEWIASIIYHDAYHVEQGRHGWHGKDRETPANLMQLDLLQKLNATQEIAHLTKVIEKGDHSDLDGDGKYTMADYNLRRH